MIVVKVMDLLANQMFAYASCKTLALDKGFDFKYYVEEVSSGVSSYHSPDKKYGRDFFSIFPIPQSEQISDIPQNYCIHAESEYKKESNYYPEFFMTQDNTLMIGHFICPRYFYHRIDEVRKWFSFPLQVENEVEEEIQKIRREREKLVSVHFRVGKDYRNYGFLLDSSYWIDAAKEAIKLMGSNVKFVVFYDRKTRFVKRFLKTFNCIESHGSLVHDLCAITKCDAHIISNSSFSIMGVLLNKSNPNIVIRPSIYPTSHMTLAEGTFMPEWRNVKAHRDKVGYMCSLFRIGRIQNKVHNTLHKVKKKVNQNA